MQKIKIEVPACSPPDLMDGWEWLQIGADIAKHLLTREFEVGGSPASASGPGQFAERVAQVERRLEQVETQLQKSSEPPAPGSLVAPNNLPSCELEPQYVTVREAAEEYFQGKVSRRAVHDLFVQGRLRGFRAGGKILIYRSSLEDYRRAHENQPPSRKNETSRVTGAEPRRPRRPSRRGRAPGLEVFKPPPGFGAH